MRIGEYQDLRIARESPHGLYLEDEEGVEVLLPNSQRPARAHIDDVLKVFVYTDSEDRPVATLKHPYATVGQFANLQAKSVTSAGAFLDWGLDKDLFCPIKEQRSPMREGDSYVVRVYLDQVSGRVACSSKITKFLDPEAEGLEPGQPIQIMVVAITPELISVIIDDRVKGSLFRDEWHERLQVGDFREAFVKSIRREDRKIAVSLRPQGYEAILGERDKLLQALRMNGGSLPVTDKSSPDEIQRRFGLSKGAFKKLIGALYKEGRIELDTHCIRLRGR